MALLAAAIVGYVVPAYAGTADDLERLAKGFEDAALRLHDDTQEPTEIVRWDGTIAMAFANPLGAPRQARLMREAVREIAAIAGVTVREVEADDPAANFVGKFSDASAAGGSTSNCFSSTAWESGRMRRVEFNVGTRLGFGGDRCVVHEVLHGFGFRSHPHGLDSILSYVYNREGLATVDRLLIETLYDKRLKPGMAREEAAPIACRILGQKTGVHPIVAAAVCTRRGRSAPPPLHSVSSERDRP